MGEPFLLLIDENPDDVYLMLRELRRSEPNIRVHVISDSTQALSYLTDAEELPAALLLGLKFIRLSGIELLAKLRSLERTRHLPVVLLTAGHEESYRVKLEVAEDSPVACVSKPIERTSIVSILGGLGVSLTSVLAG